MISNQCNYALRAVLELGKRDGSGPTAIHEIAEAQEIPARFLEAILRHLKQAGLLDSVRGKGGGYLLARPPGQIQVGEIIRQIEGTMVGPRPGHQGPKLTEELFGQIWTEAEDALAGVFNAITVRDLVEREKVIRNKYVSNYII